MGRHGGLPLRKTGNHGGVPLQKTGNYTEGRPYEEDGHPQGMPLREGAKNKIIKTRFRVYTGTDDEGHHPGFTGTDDEEHHPGFTVKEEKRLNHLSFRIQNGSNLTGWA